MLTARSFLLLLDEVGGGGGGRGCPHAADHADAVLGEGGQGQLLPLLHLDVLELLEPPQGELQERGGGGGGVSCCTATGTHFSKPPCTSPTRLIDKFMMLGLLHLRNSNCKR